MPSEIMDGHQNEIVCTVWHDSIASDFDFLITGRIDWLIFEVSCLTGFTVSAVSSDRSFLIAAFLFRSKPYAQSTQSFQSVLRLSMPSHFYALSLSNWPSQLKDSCWETEFNCFDYLPIVLGTYEPLSFTFGPQLLDLKLRNTEFFVMIVGSSLPIRCKCSFLLPKPSSTHFPMPNFTFDTNPTVTSLSQKLCFLNLTHYESICHYLA